MSITDELLAANEHYAKNFTHGSLPRAAARKVAILTCMDSRIIVEELLGLKIGDAHTIRNAGGIATDDALRSLIISHHLQNTQEFIIINHTDCSLLTFSDDQLTTELEEKSGVAVVTPAHYHAFNDLQQNVRQQMARIQNHPYVQNVLVRGFVYDVKTGKLTEVLERKPRVSQRSA
jgi:carbonic anhydrase